MYKQDFALNNLQELMCHKIEQTKPNQTKIIAYMYIYIYIYMCVCVCVCVSVCVVCVRACVSLCVNKQVLLKRFLKSKKCASALQ